MLRSPYSNKRFYSFILSQRSFYNHYSPLTPKELFVDVCSPGEDINSSSDTDSCAPTEAAEREPSVGSKVKKDGAGLATEPCGPDRCG